MEQMEKLLANKLQTQLEQSSLFTPFLGINVTIHDHHHGMWSGTSGYCNPVDRLPQKVNSLHLINSITKTFTAVALLKLVAKKNFF